ncbi:hypothetical protein CFOL_v3_27436 [Cephalotus follicularis]|uniref:Protein FAR1-RELATED SEQUENCE n=1 Tax=Cephalotus follicularis TaxID=3775 RepID=A0A1Q3CV36_CEPFO|nr:hypothetical protein CFOL_v3_27436 [Cephalotus follicularis]
MFVVRFEVLVKGWHRKEVDEDFHCYRSSAPHIIKHSILLKHANDVYTHILYKLFEVEYLKGVGACDHEVTQCDATLYKIELTTHERGSKVRVIFLDISTSEVRFICKKIECLGILCSHGLVTLYIMNFKRIPKQYILNRWTKKARGRMYCEGELSQRNSNEYEIVLRNLAMRLAYDLVTMGQGQEGKEVVWSTLQNGRQPLHDVMKKLSLDGQSKVRDGETNEHVHKITSEEDETPMLDPHCVRTKGISNSKLKGHLEKVKKP